MTSNVTLTLDLTAKTGRVTDLTDYSLYGIDVSTNVAKALAVIRFQGEIIVDKSSTSSPLIDLQSGATYFEFPLELDSSGQPAYGTYQIENYQVFFAVASSAIDSDAGTQTITVPSQGGLADAISAGDSLFFNKLLPLPVVGLTTTVVSAEAASGALVVTVESGVVDYTNVAGSLSFTANTFEGTYVYSGCTQVTGAVTLTPDCDYGDNGTWTVNNSTIVTTQTLVSTLATINYPSWTGEDPIVVTSLPYVNNRLATGTYSVVAAFVYSQVENDGLILKYTTTVKDEFDVTCNNSLCGLSPCIEALRAAHAAELLRNKISKYQVYVDNVNLYYLEAVGYKSCGDNDAFMAAMGNIKLTLEASGCDCGCCDEDSLMWVYNTSNSAQTAIEVLQAEVLALQNPTVYNEVLYYSQIPFASAPSYYPTTLDFSRPFTDISAVTIDKKYFDADPNGYSKKFVEIEFSSYSADNVQATISVVGGDTIYTGTNASPFVDVTVKHKVVLTTIQMSAQVFMVVNSQAQFVDNDDNASKWIPYSQLYDTTLWDLTEDLVLDFTPLLNSNQIVYTDFKITAIAIP